MLGIRCREALEQSVLELATKLKPDEVVQAASGNLVPPLAGLPKRAEGVGWTLEEAEVAIGELSQNLLVDMAAK